MVEANQSSVTDFFIVGFPGLQPQYYGLVTAVLILVYVFILLGNTMFLVIFYKERSLHKPMYIVILNLVASDMLFSTLTLPKIIARYWFQAGSISFLACFVQMYFVHFFGMLNSLTLLIMALDRYVAICHPLKYVMIMTKSNIYIFGLIPWLISHARPLMLVLRAYPLPYCSSNKITQCFCDHASIISLACTDRTTYTLAAFLFTVIILFVPLTFIIFSYSCIVVAVLQIATIQGRFKTLSTCSTQLTLITIFYLPRFFVYLANSVGIQFNTDLRICIIMLYSLLPPMFNPLIYCFQTKDVRQALMKSLRKQQVDVPNVNIVYLCK